MSGGKLLSVVVGKPQPAFLAVGRPRSFTNKILITWAAFYSVNLAESSVNGRSKWHPDRSARIGLKG